MNDDAPLPNQQPSESAIVPVSSPATPQIFLGEPKSRARAFFGDKNPRHKKAVKRLRLVDQVWRITKLALNGETQPEIARKTGVPVRTVSRRLLEWRAKCLEESRANNEELVAIVQARYENIYREAMTAWRKKRDPAFLEKSLNALSKICDLRGLNAPKRTEKQITYDGLLISLYADPRELLGQPAGAAGLAPSSGDGAPRISPPATD